MSCWFWHLNNKSFVSVILLASGELHKNKLRRDNLVQDWLPPFSPLLGSKLSEGILWICKQTRGLTAGQQSQTDTSLPKKHKVSCTELPSRWSRVLGQLLCSNQCFLRALCQSCACCSDDNRWCWPDLFCLIVCLYFELPKELDKARAVRDDSF